MKSAAPTPNAAQVPAGTPPAPAPIPLPPKVEVVSLRGVFLGEEVMSTREECPKRTSLGTTEHVPPRGHDPNRPTCWTASYYMLHNAFSKRLVQLHNLPEVPGMFGVVGVELDDGKVAIIESTFAPVRYESVRDALVEKYGRYSMERLVTYTNAFGASKQGRRAVWELLDGVLEIEENTPGYRDWPTGTVSLVSGSWLRKLDARDKADTKAAAQNL